MTDYLSDIDLTRPELAELYDELPLWSAPFARLLLARVPLRRGATYLDVGAGTGFLTVELAQRCGEDSTVIAVDPWSAGFARLRRKVTYLGLGNVRLLERDAATLPSPSSERSAGSEGPGGLAEDSVDVIVSNLGINNFEDPPAVLAACHRLAKPRAKLFLTTNLTGHMAELYEAFSETLDAMRLSEHQDALQDHVAHRGTVESVTRLLEGSGFTVEEVVTDSHSWRFADGSALLRHYFIRLGFLPALKRIVPASRREETFADLEHRLNEAAQRRGELALTIPMACFEATRAAESDNVAS